MHMQIWMKSRHPEIDDKKVLVQNEWKSCDENTNYVADYTLQNKIVKIKLFSDIKSQVSSLS